MSLYNKILLLLDCSPVDNVIIAHIEKLAKIHNSHVHLFHVVHAHTLDQERVEAQRTKKCIQEAEDRLRKEGIDVSFSISEGEPEKEVLKKINEYDCDLIAMATHGHRGIADFLTGSISDVVKHNTCKPILLMKAQKSRNFL